MASLATIPQIADYLNNGYWTWSGGAPHHWGPGTRITVNTNDLTAEERVLAFSALSAWHDICNINFVFTSGAAQITYINNGSAVARTTPGTTGVTIQISSDWWFNTNINSYMYQTYLHETGHALGLGHAGPYNEFAASGRDNIFINDTYQFSVMSYFKQDNFGGATRVDVVTPQMADIFAAQDFYGAATTRLSDTTYGFNSNAGSSFNTFPVFDLTQYKSAPAFTIYDSGGIDTVDFSGYSASQIIDLNPGAWSSIGGYSFNVAIYMTTLIENAVGGSGNDFITENYAQNKIDGGEGVDTVYFPGLRSDYTLVDINSLFDGDLVGVMRPNASVTTADGLINVEIVQFIDQSVVLSDDYADGLADATAPLGQVLVNGFSLGNLLTLNDRDWFGVQLTAGTSYVIDLKGQASEDKLEDPFLRIYFNDTLLAANDDAGLDRGSQILFVPEMSGTYYIEASAFHKFQFSANEFTGTYRVAVNTNSQAHQVVAASDSTEVSVIGQQNVIDSIFSTFV